MKVFWFKIIPCIVAIYSQVLFAETYNDLLPRFQTPAVAPAQPNEFMRQALTRNQDQFKACVGTLNKDDSRNHDGRAYAKSGAILLAWEKLQNSAPIVVKVVKSDFLNEQIESCLIRELRALPNNENSGQGKILFEIDCKLTESYARKCSLAWKI